MTEQTIVMDAETQCECIDCCDGEHAGECRECAGWGDRCTADLSGLCEHCEGTGICPMCHGALSLRRVDND